MSELINAPNTSALMRRHLLATVSAAVLAAHVISADAASAQDTNGADQDRPTVWIELGGQMETLKGTSSPFTAPFMDTTSSTYPAGTLIDNQRPPRNAFGLEGKLTFQPAQSDWVFSAAVRYGRSKFNRHIHEQGQNATYSYSTRDFTKNFYVAAFEDTKMPYQESHTVLDFNVGRDVGIGKFGSEGTSTLSAGVRFAQFKETSTLNMTARPNVNIVSAPFYGMLHPFVSFHQYTLAAHAERSFHGIGPSLSWNASATVLGNRDITELSLDWGINAAVLFGRQKVKTSHKTASIYLPAVPNNAYYYSTFYPPRSAHSTRSRSVVVPNLGGFAGVSAIKGNAKISIGYRADFFFGATDTGIDARKTSALSFYGPFATISIGLGG